MTDRQTARQTDRETDMHACKQVKMHTYVTDMHAYVPTLPDTGNYRLHNAEQIRTSMCTYRVARMCTCRHKGIYSYIGACENNLHISSPAQTQMEIRT